MLLFCSQFSPITAIKLIQSVILNILKSFFIYFFTSSPQFHGIQFVVMVLSQRCDSHTDSGEAKVENSVSFETQPNQAALLLAASAGGNTIHLAPPQELLV